MNTNLISSDYWDSNWSDLRPPRPLRPWRSYVSWRFAEVFRKHIKPGDRVLEVGCGGSRCLPYFAKKLGAEVWGIDFSAEGVKSAVAALKNVGASGNIVLGDLFTTDALLEGHFDVVWSGGFIEHFTDAARTIRRMAQFAKPGSGLVITEVPNVSGAIGGLHRFADYKLFEQHVEISPARMDAMHGEAGLEVVRAASYFGTLQLAVINYRRIFGAHYCALSIFLRSIEAMELAVTLPLWMLRARPESSSLSPYVLGVYGRPA